MKKILLTLILAALLGACAPTATPEPTADAAATISVQASTIVASTLTAQPTATPIPTNTPEPSATFTPIPPTETPAAPTATLTPLASPTVFQGTLAPYDVSGLPTGLFRIENSSGEESIVVTIQGTTKPGEKPVYYSYLVTKVFLFDIPWGSYNYTVQIGTKKLYTGTFGIANKDKTTMRVFLNKIVIVGP